MTRYRNQPPEVQQHMARARGHTEGYTLNCPACQRAVKTRMAASLAATQARTRQAQWQYRRMWIAFWLIIISTAVIGYYVSTVMTP
jgi:hypothetical protein